MGMSRMEVNLRRLIAKCELIVKTDKNNPKLDKYIESLDEMMISLEKIDQKPSLDTLAEYSNRIAKLKQVLNKSPAALKPRLAAGEEKKSFKDLRQELLGTEVNSTTGLNMSNNESEVEKLLKHHGDVQDKLANEMITLAKNLKEQTILAGNIIRNDTETVKKSAVVAESNFSKLKTESEKLEEHSKRAWKCWMWVMIFVVMAVFINMVLFMKVMKKRTT